jgi:TonB family protein
MRRFLALLSFAVVLSGCSVGYAQDSSPNAPPFLKLCSHQNPPPCIDKPPVAVHTPDPEYTEKAHKARIEGTVVLGTVVGSDGRAQDIQVLKRLGYGLDEEAVKTLKEWTFKPAKSGGKPVPVKINIEMEFRYH